MFSPAATRAQVAACAPGLAGPVPGLSFSRPRVVVAYGKRSQKNQGLYFDYEPVDAEEVAEIPIEKGRHAGCSRRDALPCGLGPTRCIYASSRQLQRSGRRSSRGCSGPEKHQAVTRRDGRQGSTSSRPLVHGRAAHRAHEVRNNKMQGALGLAQVG